MLNEYQPRRDCEYPKGFLAGYKGYLHCDGWNTYHKLPDATIVGCFAHVRRLYDQTLKVLPEKDRKGTDALCSKRYCDGLFATERKLAYLSAQERYLRRLELAKPVLDEYTCGCHLSKISIKPCSAKL